MDEKIKSTAAEIKKKATAQVNKIKEKTAAQSKSTKDKVAEQKKRLKVKKAEEQNGAKRAMPSPDKLEILVTVVNREKTEFYLDLLYSFEINLQMVLNGRGTATSNVTTILGLVDLEKSVIISIVRKDKVKEALSVLEDKFNSVRNGKGVAYTIPMSSVIGVAIYQFISNKTGGGII